MASIDASPDRMRFLAAELPLVADLDVLTGFTADGVLDSDFFDETFFSAAAMTYWVFNGDQFALAAVTKF